MTHGIDGLGPHPDKNAAKRRRGTVAIALGAAILALLAVAVMAWFSMEQVYSDGPPPLAFPTSQAAESMPSPGSPTSEKADSTTIDWTYWRRINPAIIAWITIPGTPVNYPVVDAPADDPSFYLTHDLHNRFNCFGCIYRDSDCRSADTRNTVLYGHNMGWSNAMFAVLANYTDETFARQHRTVSIRTPNGIREYRVYAATVVNGLDARKHVAFTGRADFERWWQRTYEASPMKLSDKAPPTDRLLTLCTCSYRFWDNERTLVYAVPKKRDE